MRVTSTARNSAAFYMSWHSHFGAFFAFIERPSELLVGLRYTPMGRDLWFRCEDALTNVVVSLFRANAAASRGP